MIAGCYILMFIIAGVVAVWVIWFFICWLLAGRPRRFDSPNTP